MNNKTSEYVNCVFEQPWWLDAVAPDAWEEILVEEEDKIIARWPIVKMGNSIRMPHLTQTLGFWLSDNNLYPDPHLHEKKRIINLLLEKLPGKKNIYIRCDSNVDYFLPFHWKQFVISPYITYRINDLTNIDAVYDRFNNNVKRDIRHANNLVEVKAVDDIEILLKLLDKTIHRQYRKYTISDDLIRKLYNACRVNDAGKLLYAIDQNGNVYSGCLFVYDKNRCYYLLAGTDPKYKNTCVSSLIIWEGIKFASTVSKSFDFEGSMVEGIEHFFRQFGGIPTVYYYIKKQSLVFELFKLLNTIIKSLISSNQK